MIHGDETKIVLLNVDTGEKACLYEISADANETYATVEGTADIIKFESSVYCLERPKRQDKHLQAMLMSIRPR